MNYSFKMYNAENGKDVCTVSGEFEWRPEGVHQAASHTWKRALFAPLFIEDRRAGGELIRYEIGGTDTGIVVYANGKLLIPGEPTMQFPSLEEAKQYAEATVKLRDEP